MRKQIIAPLLAGLLAFGIGACTQGEPVTEWPEQDERGWFACFDAKGGFVRYDDDADCDRSDGSNLYRKGKWPKPAKTSGGMQTAKVPAPAKTGGKATTTTRTTGGMRGR